MKPFNLNKISSIFLWPNWLKIFCAAGASLTLFVPMYIFLLKPTQQQIIKNYMTLHGLQQESKKNHPPKNSVLIKKNIHFTAFSLTQLIAEINSICAKNNLLLDGIKPLTENIKEGIKVQTLQIKCFGNYAAIRQFFYQLTRLPALITIGDCLLQITADGSNTQPLEMVLTLHLYTQDL